MRKARGFTLLELVVVLAVGGILAAVVIVSFGGVQGRLGVRGAQNAILGMHAQTRALAVERGGRARLIVDVAEGVVAIDLQLDPGGTPEVVERRNFRDAYRVSLQSEPAEIVVCMTPRGYADPGCNSYGQRGVLRISGQNGREVVIHFLPLGQVVLP